jgi:hypothetical protein
VQRWSMCTTVGWKEGFMQVKITKMEMALRRRPVLFFRRKYLSMIHDGSRIRSAGAKGDNVLRGEYELSIFLRNFWPPFSFVAA